MMPDQQEVADVLEHDRADERSDAAVAVRIVSEPQSQTAAADKASWRSVQVKGNAAQQSQQLLGRQPKRHKAIIIVNGAANDFVLIGALKQADQAIGARLYVGNRIEVESQSDMWVWTTAATTSTGDVFVTVQEEIYR